MEIASFPVETDRTPTAIPNMLRVIGAPFTSIAPAWENAPSAMLFRPWDREFDPMARPPP